MCFISSVLLLYTDDDQAIVFVSFDSTTYTVTEGVDDVANLMLVRSGDLSRTVVVTVTTAAGTAVGMTCHSLRNTVQYTRVTKINL